MSYPSRMISDALLQVDIGCGEWLDLTFSDSSNQPCKFQPFMQSFSGQEAAERKFKALATFWGSGHKNAYIQLQFIIEALPNQNRDNFAVFNQTGHEIGRIRADRGYCSIEAFMPESHAKVLDISRINGNNGFAEAERQDRIIAALILLKREFTP